jgi:hypothetical protein
MKTIKKYSLRWWINTLSKIPEKKWCINIRDNGQGAYCVLGHMDRLEKSMHRDVLFDNRTNVMKLAYVNNGPDGTGAYIENSEMPSVAKFLKLDSPKKRSLAYMRSLLKKKS